jgi:RNA polymerase sigma-70 factor (ECF subfamily)
MAKHIPATSSPLSEEDEAALLAACQSDPAAFTSLYHRYVAAVYRYVYFRVGNLAEAEDLVSQVFLAALESLPNYRHRGYFAAWLFGIARRKIADHYRHARAVPLDDLSGDATIDPDPLTQVIADEELRRLSALIARQPAADQELLRLRYAAGLSFDQMAAVLQRNPAAVKMSLYRLLDRLEKQLDLIEK